MPRSWSGVSVRWLLDFPKYIKYHGTMSEGHQKRKMGRPPLPREARRSAIVTLRMTEADRKRLERQAAEAGLSISAFLLKCWQEKGE